MKWDGIDVTGYILSKVPVFNRFPNSFTHKKKNLIFHSKQYNSVSNWFVIWPRVAEWIHSSKKGHKLPSFASFMWIAQTVIPFLQIPPHPKIWALIKVHVISIYYIHRLARLYKKNRLYINNLLPPWIETPQPSIKIKIVNGCEEASICKYCETIEFSCHIVNCVFTGWV